MTDEQLGELERLEKVATKAPWFLLGAPWAHPETSELAIVAGNPDPHKGVLVADCDLDVDWSEDENDCRIQERRDAAFIMAARNAIPALLALVKEQKAEIERLKEFEWKFYKEIRK